MKTSAFILAVLFASQLSPAWASQSEVTLLRTVPSVDLSRYVGTWYEIARLPNRFQKDCAQSTAKYSLREEGKIDVLNSCRKLSDGSLKEAHGLAEVVDRDTNSKLRVIFTPGLIRWLGIGWGNYWIIELEPEYKYVVVSEPGREYLWILSRTPVMEKSVYEGILERLKANGFDVSKLIHFSQ
ncbi:MAG: hypothetical protein A2070_00865 [Bdellovibrionales bacterium GWC1_52_8]|nr:MAG: hypothetical protein A2X97_11445 [Bdellovibrionales bacterium GWA1_52_35]OFZ38415.1 MAG: hypothetical protein A2070_00865 [Bdellovibrionales bacterium GWC1_52_8]HCM39152.1 lipocalin [Bdellovibrionales bacterium]